MGTRIRALLAATGLLLCVLALGTPAEAKNEGDVLRVKVEGVVTRGTTLQVKAALEEAEGMGIPLLVELNTPGGLVDATLDIDLALASARVPVLTFVGPQGAYAASAGTFLLLMGQPSGMAPSTTIGSAQPITIDPDGGTSDAGEKVENFLVGRIRAIAERTGRNADVAERFITENLNLNGSAALAQGLIDVTADDAQGFLRAVHGREARTVGGPVVLNTQGNLLDYERTLLSQVVDLLSNPQVAFILVLAGTYALIFGLANAGTYVPETIGVLLLLLGFLGLGLFSTSTAGVLLLLVGVAFLVAEVFTPTHGVLSVAGVIALFFAVLFLVDEPLLPTSFLRTFYVVGIGLAVLSGGAAFTTATIALRHRKRPAVDSILGARGRVIEPVAPEGRVEVFGEVWRATTKGPGLQEGAEVEVVAREGLTLEVRPAPADADAPASSPPS